MQAAWGSALEKKKNLISSRFLQKYTRDTRDSVSLITVSRAWQSALCDLIHTTQQRSPWRRLIFTLVTADTLALSTYSEVDRNARAPLNLPG